jgi:hypothetical protein
MKLSPTGNFLVMKHFVLGVFWIASLVLGSGCVVHSNPGGGTVQAGSSAFVIRNESAVAICYVKISPSADQNWGPDRLGASEVISPGQERGWEFPSGYYDFQLQDCNRAVIMERRQLAFESNDGFVLTFRAPE